MHAFGTLQNGTKQTNGSIGYDILMHSPQNAVGWTPIHHRPTMNKVGSEFYADANAPIVSLSAKKHFDELSAQEKRYAHYLSRASHWGTRAVLRSVSPESESIYSLIIAIHESVKGDYSKLKSDCGDQVVKTYLEYASQFLSNLGNYKSFGDTKFIPRISREGFAELVTALNNPSVKQIWLEVNEAIYTINDKSKMLGWPDKGHVTGYYINSISKNEAESINSALAEKGIMPENTRVEKAGDCTFVIHVASSERQNLTTYYPGEIEFSILGQPAKMKIQFGDHAAEFAKIVDSLSEAKMNCANEIEQEMLASYIASFQTGSMNAHKESQISWVKNIGPSVETNIGFIETYRDPAGVRGEWEGLVAMVNVDRTRKFSKLVEKAKNFITLLPWSSEWEKETFSPPDFTSLEVLTFAGSGIPAGINIPNYDDVRINIGFKNVSLGNILSAKSGSEPVTFLEEKDKELFNKYRGEAFEVQVGIHELLGHGTGKLLQQVDDDEYNFDLKNPPLGLDEKPVTTFYKKGETWGSLFGSCSGSFEECRAECVAMYLGTNRDILSIFGFDSEKVQNDVIYISYLSMCRAGLLALEQWDPLTGNWGQPHMRARYAIFKVLLDAGQGLVSLCGETPAEVTIQLDASKIESEGKPAIGEFLRKLHLYKCSADSVAGIQFYNEATTVVPEIAKLKDVVLEKRLPRKQFIQGNTFIDADGNVEVREYQETVEGMIQSFLERGV